MWKEREEKLPAVDEIENHTYAVRNEKIYYRSGEEIRLVKLTEKKVQRLTGMIGLSSHVTEMLRQQRENCSDEVLEGLQKELKEKYDAFVKKYGEITEKANRSLFENDRYSPFLFSLEQQDKDGNRIYSDLFYQRILKNKKTNIRALIVIFFRVLMVCFRFIERTIIHSKDTTSHLSF